VGRECSVCASPSREAVDRQLGAGRPAHAIGKEFALGERAVQRHRANHLSAAIAQVMTQSVGATRIVDRLEALVEKVSRLVDQAEASGSNGIMLAACREVRSGLELLARLSGELDERPTTVVNLLSSPEVQQLFVVMDSSLSPWPEAKLALAAGLYDAGVADER
jgi:O-succinylbenzoate synthase